MKRLTVAGAFIAGTTAGFLAGIAATLGMAAAIERGVTVSPENTVSNIPTPGQPTAGGRHLRVC